MQKFEKTMATAKTFKVCLECSELHGNTCSFLVVSCLTHHCPIHLLQAPFTHISLLLVESWF